VYTKVVDVNVVSAETFRHVKKSLILQKRPIYQPNVTVVGNIPNFDTLTDDLPNYSSATFSEAVLLDDDDIDDLISLPMAHNIYWDPFAKCLRIDPKLGKVRTDQTRLDHNAQQCFTSTTTIACRWWWIPHVIWRKTARRRPRSERSA
jgi:hypothetical protein